jgi:cell division protease FtsH
MIDGFQDLEDGQEMDEDRTEGTTPAAKSHARTRPNADQALIGAAFEAALPPGAIKRFRRAKAVAIVILIPAASWVDPVRHWLKIAFARDWYMVAPDTTWRAKAAPGATEVAERLSRGECVLGMATDAASLPASLVVAADETIRIPPLGPETLRRAIARFTGRSRSAVPETVVAGLDLEQVITAMRPGSGPRRIVQRLELAATRSVSAVIGGDDVPDLERAIEYGRAREWGLDLARDVNRGVPFKELPRGVVIHGPPGTGKSLFSRVLAKKCNLPLLTTSVGDWFNNKGTYDDVIRSFGRIMDQAAAHRQAIVFIDEIDGLPNRTALSDSRNSDYWKPLCNYVLTRLDNSISDQRSGIIVLGATNDVKSLDPALMRPGRLELAIELNAPDLTGMTNILRFHAPELAEADLRQVAAMGERKTGAELMYLVREGRRLAREAGRGLQVGDLLRLVVPPLRIGPAALRRVCIHEAGHAVATLALGNGILRSVAIGTHDGRGGMTVSEPVEDVAVTRSYVEGQATGLLAGRAAERVLLGTMSAGAGGIEGSDLHLATRMLAAMHANAGLGGTIA